jgi:hypothetical protein
MGTVKDYFHVPISFMDDIDMLTKCIGLLHLYTHHLNATSK